MTRQQSIVLLLVGLGLVIAADRIWYRPMKAEEARQEQEHKDDCWRKLAQIRAEGGDAAKEQINGKLTGCRGTFGTTLG